jgi:branched-chain amino acid transport system substrate-binding protein
VAGQSQGAADREGFRTTAPFFDARQQVADYSGPGREDPPPADLEEIAIGWFGPVGEDATRSSGMWRAAALALEEVNRAGGYKGLPFRLASAWSSDPWGSGVKSVTRLVYSDRVWAIVGAPDGPSTHLAEQVVAKARLALISPVATDASANLANVGWVFSCVPSDDRLAEVLAVAVVNRSDEQRLTVVSATDHDSRVLTIDLLQALKRRGIFPSLHIQFQPGTTEFTGHLQRLTVSDDPVVVIAGPDDSARFLVALGRRGTDRMIFGGPAMGTQRFIRRAGSAAEGAVFPLLWHPDADESAAEFAFRFRERFRSEPDYLAASAYDAVNLLVAAIRDAGPNRARIRDAVRGLAPYDGVTGKISWDATGRNEGTVGLGTIECGRIVTVGRLGPRPHIRSLPVGR